MQTKEIQAVDSCSIDHTADRKKRIMAVLDTMELLNGKWKIIIIGTLSFFGKKKFMELKREIDGIGSKMLSKELQELELNKLIKRTVCRQYILSLGLH